jgi:hypothetical protein
MDLSVSDDNTTTTRVTLSRIQSPFSFEENKLHKHICPGKKNTLKSQTKPNGQKKTRKVEEEKPRLSCKVSPFHFSPSKTSQPHGKKQSCRVINLETVAPERRKGSHVQR